MPMASFTPLLPPPSHPFLAVALKALTDVEAQRPKKMHTLCNREPRLYHPATGRACQMCAQCNEIPFPCRPRTAMPLAAGQNDVFADGVLRLRQRRK